MAIRLVSFLLLVGTAFAFHLHSSTFKQTKTARLFGVSFLDTKPKSFLNAYIFSGPDDQVDCTYGISGSFVNVDDDVTVTPTPIPATSAFVDFINREAAALARLAVAYSPVDRTINIKNINQVKLLNLSDTHIDIEALVCDDVACVSLAVPVSFPSNCSDKSRNHTEFEHCVIDNLGELDRLATQAIDKMLEAEQQEAMEIESFRNMFGKPLL
jgi:hypothetical protein